MWAWELEQQATFEKAKVPIKQIRAEFWASLKQGYHSSGHVCDSKRPGPGTVAEATEEESVPVVEVTEIPVEKQLLAVHTVLLQVEALGKEWTMASNGLKAGLFGW